MLLRAFIACFVALIALPSPALAGMDVQLSGIGRNLATEHCGACHAVAPGNLSPNSEAPPFKEVAKLYPPETLEEALAEGIMVGHDDMPAFEFTADQVEQLIAFLKSLE